MRANGLLNLDANFVQPIGRRSERPGSDGSSRISPIFFFYTTRIAVLLLFCLLSADSRAAQVEEAWVQRFNPPLSTNGFTFASKVLRDGAGDIIVAGRAKAGISRELGVLIKYAGETGKVLWQRFDGAPPQDVALDNKGNVVVVSFFFHTAKYAATDGKLLWERNYGAEHNYIETLALDSSGNVFVTGYSPSNGGNDIYYTAKYAASDGVLLWEQRNGIDIAKMVVDTAGNLVVAGYSYRSSSDFYTAKYAGSNGNLLWERIYDGPSKGPDQAATLALNSDGDVIATGFSYNPTNQDLYTAKYSGNDGKLLWEQRYDTPTHLDDRPQSLLIDSTGDVFVIGYASEEGQEIQTMIKYAAADGTALWMNRKPFGSAWALDASNNLLLTGMSASGNSRTCQLSAYAAPNGASIWEGLCEEDTTGPFWVSSMLVAPGGDLILAGSSKAGLGTELFVAKYSVENKMFLWEAHSQGPGYREGGPVAVAVDSHGDIAVLLNAATDRNYDHYLCKYAAANGALLWSQRFDGQRVDDYYWEVPDDGDVKFAPDGSIVVTGYGIGADGRIRYHTAKHASSDGAIIWQQNHDGPIYADIGSQTITLDPNGNVFLAAYALGCPFVDSYLAKYAAADGAVLWEIHCDSNDETEYCQAFGGLVSDANGNFVLKGGYLSLRSGVDASPIWTSPAAHSLNLLGMDTAGNLVVTGEFHPETGPSYQKTAKYSSIDGSMLWERRYKDVSSSDRVSGMAVDAAGNVAVAGFPNLWSNHEVYIAKYAAGDGALLWEKTYQFPGIDTLFTLAVAIDAAGDVVVAGSSGDWGNRDLFTAKFQASNGMILWKKLYNGPGNGDDGFTGSRCLALAPGGGVIVAGRSQGVPEPGDHYEAMFVNYVKSPTLIRLAGCTYRVDFPVVPGLSYTLQRAASPLGPWNDLTTSTGPATGRLVYTDTSPLPGSAFYRTVTP
ncbi:MAG: hypothetical protein JWM16_2799 [Verrucomicrobiales bacterium]|nr:hypothetical protein [Verrucomicrobiales bacterium]